MINLKTAKALGVVVPPTLLARRRGDRLRRHEFTGLSAPQRVCHSRQSRSRHFVDRILGDEADINPAQTKDQEIYNLLPVTDSEDLRRLRALYHYAVCPGDRNAFSLEWGLADRRYFQSAPTARASHTTSAAAKKPTLADVIRSDLTDPNNKDAKPADIANLIASKIAPSPTPEQVKSIKDIVASKDENIDGEVAGIIQAVGKEAHLLKRYAAPTPGKAVAGKSDQTNGATPADSVAYKE